MGLRVLRGCSQDPSGAPAARAAHYSPRDSQCPKGLWLALQEGPFPGRTGQRQDSTSDVSHASPPSHVTPAWIVSLGVCTQEVTFSTSLGWLSAGTTALRRGTFMGQASGCAGCLLGPPKARLTHTRVLACGCSSAWQPSPAFHWPSHGLILWGLRTPLPWLCSHQPSSLTVLCPL